MPLRLRPYCAKDEAAAIAAHEALLPEDFTFLLGWSPDISWSTFLAALAEQRRGENLSENRVRAAQLAAEVNGVLVGRVSIRFTLNDFFFEHAGHIGYGVIPEQRRKGYASEILRQALIVIRADGVERVLVTCHEHNLGSARAIERCGGSLEKIVPALDGGPGLCRYWIN